MNIKDISAKIAKSVEAAFSNEKFTKKVELKKERTEYVEANVPDLEIKVIAEAWEVGQELFIEGEEGDVMLAPAGEYVLDNGATLTVDEEGLITNIEGEVSTEEPEEEMAKKKEEEMAKTPVTQAELEKAMTAVTETITNTLLAHFKDQAKKNVKQSEEDKKKDKEKVEQSEIQKAKIEALKDLHANRRKKLKQKETKKDAITQFNEQFDKNEKDRFQFPFRNGTQERASKLLEDFDFAEN